MIKVMQCVMHSQMFVLRVTRPLWSGARLFKYRASVPQVLFDKLVLWQHLNRKPRHICHQFAVIVIQQPIIVLISFHHFPLQLASQVDLLTLPNPLTSGFGNVSKSTYNIAKHYKMFTISYKHRVRT